MSHRAHSYSCDSASARNSVGTEDRSRAARVQKKSERFEQRRLNIRRREMARHRRYVDAFKRAGSAFRMWWLMLLGVMTKVVRPIVRNQALPILRAPEPRRRSVAPHAAYAVEHLESRQLLTAGTVDLSYGNNGVMQVSMGAFDDDAFAVALQGDGKAVVAGPVYSAGGVEFGVTRFNADGTLDWSFGDEGKVRTQFGTSSSTPASVIVQPDGRIVVGGFAFNGSNFDFALARYMPNGDLDLSFGAFGRTVRAIGSGNDFGQRLALQADGKILLGGDSFSGDYEDFAIARFETDGTLDTSFGTNGIFKRGLGSQRDSLRGLAVQPDGKIVATGYVFTNTNVLPALLRLNTNGTLDPTLNGDGFTFHSFGASTSVYSGNVSVLSDGRIIVGGVAFSGGRNQFAAIRYLDYGGLDTSFDGDGLLLSPIRPYSDSASQIFVRPDGKFYLGGNSYGSTDQDFAVARYNPNGTLDSTFGTNGATTIAIGAGDDIMNAMAVQSDGNLLLAGSVHKAGYSDFTIARIIGTSAPHDLTLTPDVIPENSPFGTTIGNFTSTDADGTDTFTYSLVTGTGATDNARFYVSGNQLKVSTELDYELKPNYSIQVRTTDQNGKFFEKAFSVSVSNINEAPVVAGLDVSTYNGVAELIQFSAVDPEGNAFTWSIIEPPQHGSLTGSGSSRTYTPDPGYVGADEFLIAANDGTSSSNQAVVRITNSSTARPTVTLSSSTATISEAGPSFMLTAQIDVAQGSSVIIPLSYSGTATAGRDFNAVTEIVIPAGQTTASVPIFVTNDLAYETPGESVIVSIPAGQSYELGTTVSQTISITDDDPLPTVSFRSKSIQTAEQELTLELSVVLNAESQSPVTVPLVWSGSAVRGVDFDGPNEITIPAGSRVGTVQIQIHDDAQEESAETILVSMGVPSGAIVSTAASDATSTRVLITANDAPIVSLVSASLRVQESVGQVIVEAKLASPATATLTVPFTVTGTGTVGVDFTPASGSFVFGVGKTTASAVITVLDDTAIEQSETVIVTLDDSAAFQKGSIGSTTLDIRDNDTVKVNFQSQVTSVWENQGPASIRATISASSIELRTIPLLLWEPKVPIEGYASLGSDFQAFPLQLVFQPGSTVSDPLLIPFINDSINETFEQITIAMTAIPGVELGSTAQTVIVIKDNDPLVRLSGPGSGGEAGIVRTFTAVLDHATNVDVVLPMTISGTAQRGSDYTGPTSNSIVIPAGSTTGSVTFNVIDDVIFEDDETLTVRINNPLDGSATLIEPTVSTSTIFNNDGAPRVYLTPGDFFVHKGQKLFYQKMSEKNGTRTLTLLREGATQKDIYVTLGGATERSSLYRVEGPITSPGPGGGVVRIPANRTGVTLTVRAVDEFLFRYGGKIFRCDWGVSPNAAL
ncbi:MAG: Calx-beta domain-containing protein [Planctomycetaceae bacterium]